MKNEKDEHVLTDKDLWEWVGTMMISLIRHEKAYEEYKDLLNPKLEKWNLEILQGLSDILDIFKEMKKKGEIT